MKIVVVAGLIAIVVALFSALVFLYRDRGHGTRMVKALAIRVGLSILLVTFLLVSYFMGWISPQGFGRADEKGVRSVSDERTSALRLFHRV